MILIVGLDKHVKDGNVNRRYKMPKVGGKQFPYSKAGQKAAKTYAKSMGKTMTKRKPKRKSK